jgi:hypothetical protein
MITDDPGTPGPNHWEINVAWADQRNQGEGGAGLPGPYIAGTTLTQLPVIDANYGVGDRIQLNYHSSYNILKETGSATVSNIADTQLAVKWRYYDEGEHGLQLSIYPRYTFLTPGSRKVDWLGLSQTTSTFLMPFEAVKDLGWASIDVDVGYTFSAEKAARGYTGGVCLGREIVKGWELDAEIHGLTDAKAGKDEWTANLGSRIDLSEHATILLAIGTDLSDDIGPKISLLTYTGMQFRF